MKSWIKYFKLAFYQSLWICGLSLMLVLNFIFEWKLLNKISLWLQFRNYITETWSFFLAAWMTPWLLLKGLLWYKWRHIDIQDLVTCRNSVCKIYRLKHVLVCWWPLTEISATASVDKGPERWSKAVSYTLDVTVDCAKTVCDRCDAANQSFTSQSHFQVRGPPSKNVTKPVRIK